MSLLYKVLLLPFFAKNVIFAENLKIGNDINYKINLWQQ